jgi:hypothetical protein
MTKLWKILKARCSVGSGVSCCWVVMVSLFLIAFLHLLLPCLLGLEITNGYLLDYLDVCN